MRMKVLEIRDSATCIPALAIKMTPTNGIEDQFLWRCGYPRDGLSGPRRTPTDGAKPATAEICTALPEEM